MKQLVVLLVLVALIGVLVGLWILDDPGYVLVIRDAWQLETTLGFAFFVLVLAATVVAVVTLLVGAAWDVVSPFGASGRWHGWLARHRIQSGFQALVEGRWQKAERQFTAATRAPRWRIMAALGAAEAACEQGEYETARRHLDTAGDSKASRLAAGLMTARIALEHGHPAEARAVLMQLREQAPKNPRLLQLLGESFDRTEDWTGLVALLPALRSLAADQPALRRLERRAWHGWMKQAAEAATPAGMAPRLEALRSIWKKMPAELQKEPAMRAQYAGYLAHYGDGEAALAVIRKDLEINWDDRLPAVLESIINVAPERLLALLEGWLEVRPGNAVLLLTAGRVALRAHLWGKARSLFEAAGGLGNAIALAELARLHAAMGNNERAVAVLEKRLRLMDAHLPDLPLPSRHPD